MFALLFLLVVAIVIGYFLGRGKTGERLQNWYAGWRAPRKRNRRKMKLKVMRMCKR